MRVFGDNTLLYYGGLESVGIAELFMHRPTGGTTFDLLEQRVEETRSRGGSTPSIPTSTTR